jgi:hypothetical protein
VISQLAPQEQSLIQGHIIIKPKVAVANDINAVDAET